MLKYFLILSIAFFVATAKADNCKTMAEMAENVANLRDAGVPLISVEQRLRNDVSNADELMLGLIVARLVYKTNGTGAQLRKEVIKKCK